MAEKESWQDLHSGPSLMDFMPKEAEPKEFLARAGQSRVEGCEVFPVEKEILEAIQTVYDPEIPVNIYELGLIYGVKINGNGNIYIEMTLTAPGCPVAGELPGWVAEAVAEVEGAGVVEVTLVWNPPWTADMMSEDAKLALGM